MTVATSPRPTPTLRASVVASFAGKAAEMVTLLALATVVPRALGPRDYGRFSVPLAVVTITSLALTLGGATTLARFVPAAPPDQRVALARRLGRRLALGRAAQLGALAGAAAVVAAVDPQRFPPRLTALVIVAVAANVGATLALQVGLGLGRTVPWSARYPLQNVVLVVAAVALHRAAGVTGAVTAVVVAGVVALGLGAAVVRPLASGPAPAVDLPPGAIRFGVLQAAGAGCTQVAHRGGVVAVALLGDAGPEAAGHAALALGIALGVTYAVLQMFTVSLPHLVGEGGAPTADGLARAEATSRRFAGTVLAVLTPAAAVAAVGLGAVVPAVFGSGYDDAVGAFGPALAMVVLAPLTALAVHVSALRLRPRASLAAGAAALGAFLVTAAAAVPAWGAPGGTAAALAGAAASALTSLALLHDAIGARLAVGSFAGAAGVLVLALAAA